MPTTKIDYNSAEHKIITLIQDVLANIDSRTFAQLGAALDDLVPLVEEAQVQEVRDLVDLFHSALFQYAKDREGAEPNPDRDAVVTALADLEIQKFKVFVWQGPATFTQSSTYRFGSGDFSFTTAGDLTFGALFTPQSTYDVPKEDMEFVVVTTLAEAGL